jgi:acyl-CoA thioester hydrolase
MKNTSPQSKTKTHSFPVRVYMEDTDAQGLVYFANYLKFAERARTELLRSRGISHATLIKEGVMFVVYSCLLNCLASSRLDEVLEVRTDLKKLGYVKLEVSQAIFRGEILIATLDIGLAFVNVSGKPIKMDDHIRHLLVNL